MTVIICSAMIRGVMKRSFFYLALLSGIFAGVMVPTALADESPAPKTEKKVKKSDSSAVKAAIEDIEFLTDNKPSKKAKYYIYLHSASWCSPCKALMPEIVKEYK